MIDEITREGADRWTFRLLPPNRGSAPNDLLKWSLRLYGVTVTVICDMDYVYANLRQAENRLAKMMEKVSGATLGPESTYLISELIYRFRKDVFERYERNIPMATIATTNSIQYQNITAATSAATLNWTNTSYAPPPKPKTALDWLRAQVDEVCAVGRKELAA